MNARRPVSMAIRCTQRSCVSHVEMFQYASAKKMDKWAIFQYAHYKIRKKKTSPSFSIAVHNFLLLDGKKFLFDKNTTFFLLLVLRCKSIVSPFLY